MSCSSSSNVSMDSMQIEKSSKSEDDDQTLIKSKEDEENEEESMNMSQSVGLFRKYPFTKTQHNIGKTNQEESEATGRAPIRPLVPPIFGDTFRPLSLLEQSIPPQFKHNTLLPTSSDESSPAQLTIFYSGAINVYDNVSIEKAQAIMLFAGYHSSLSAPTVTNEQEMDVATPLQIPNSHSLCKLQAGFPLSRKYSLQRFLENRRSRRRNKYSPYDAPSTSTAQHEDTDDPSTIKNQKPSSSRLISSDQHLNP